MSLTALVFLVAFFGGLGLSLVRSPIFGLYAYIAVFYLHPPSRWWGAPLPDLRWSLLAAAVTLISVAIHRKEASNRPPFLSHGLAWIFMFYVLWMWIQLPFVVSTEQLTGAILFSKYLVLMFLLYAIVDTSERVRNVLLAHVAGCFYLAWLAYTAEGTGRLEGVGGPGIDDSNTMTMQLATGIVVGSMLLMTEAKTWRFWLPLIAMPFLVNGVMQGSSRGGFLGLIAGGLCLFWLKPRAYRKQFMAFGILGAAMFLYLANELFLDRITSLTAVTSEEEDLDFSAASRLVIMGAEWRMFLDHPFGAGHMGTAELSPQYLSAEYLTRSSDGSIGRSSHNTFTSVLVDQGVPGIVLLVMLLVWVWRSSGVVTKRSGRIPRVWGYGTAVVGALAVAVVAGQFAPYLKAEVQFWLLSLLMCLKALEDSKAVLEPTPEAPARDGPRGMYGPRKPAWAARADRDAAPRSPGAPKHAAGSRK